MILDRNFYPSTFRAGYWIMPPALSSWLDNWLPLDYTPLYGLPWYPTNPTGGRYQVATRYGVTQSDIDLSFAQAESSGKAVYSDSTHSWEDMAQEISSLQGNLQVRVLGIQMLILNMLLPKKLSSSISAILICRRQCLQ